MNAKSSGGRVTGRRGYERRGSEAIRGEWWLMLAAIVLALVIRLRYYGGLASIDDFNYLRHAAEVWQGRFNLADVAYWHGMRPLLFVPISWLFALFGVSEATATLFPLLGSLLTVFLIARIARLLAGPRAAVAAAFLAAVFPLAVEESTRVLPGPLINLLIASSAYFFLRAEERTGTRPLLLALSGVLLASIPWAGHLGLVFVVFFPAAIVLYRSHPFLSYWPLAAGFALMMVVTVLSQWWVAGDPMANLAVARHVLTSENATPRPLFYLSLMTYPFRSHGGTFYFAAVGGVFALLSRDRGARLALAWFLLMYAILEFGSSSITDYRPLFKQARYLSALYVPGIVLAGIGLVVALRFLQRWMPRWLPLGFVIAFLGFGCGLTLERNTRWRSEERAQLHEIRDAVRGAALRGEMVYVSHWLWNTRAAFYLGYRDGYSTSGYAPYKAVRHDRIAYDSNIRYVQTLTAGEPMRTGILLNDIGLYRLSVGERQVSLVGPGDIPPVLGDPPPSWAVMDTVSINRVNEVVVHRIPEGAVWPGDGRP